MENNFFTPIVTLILLNSFILFFHNTLKKYGIPKDLPDNERKLHKNAVPLSGGVIFFFNIIILILFKKYFPLGYIESSEHIDVIFLFSLLLFFFGYADDKYDLNPYIKLTLLIISILYLFYFNDDFLIKELKFSFLENNIQLGNFSLFFTLLCYLLFINAFNMFDGINLQSTIFFISFVIYFLINNFMLFFNILIIPCIIIFALLNYKNKSFLGDSGCFLISFIIGSLSILAYNNNNIQYCDTIFLLMMIPGIDMLRLFFERIVKKKSPFLPDRRHLHHLLLNKFGYFKTIFILFIFININLVLVIFNFDSRLILSIFLIFYPLILFKLRN